MAGGVGGSYFGQIRSGIRRDPAEFRHCLGLADARRGQLEWIVRYHEIERKISKSRKAWNIYESEAHASYQQWYYITFSNKLTLIQELTEECNKFKTIISAVNDQIVVNDLNKKTAFLYVLNKAENNQDPYPTEIEYQKFEREESFRNEHYEDGFESNKSDIDKNSIHDFIPVTENIINEDYKIIYRKLVKLLHPDRGIAMDLNETRLWGEAQIAYSNSDSGALRSILMRIENNGSIQIHLLESIGEIIEVVKALILEFEEMNLQKNRLKNSFVYLFWDSRLGSKNRQKLTANT